MGQQFVIYMGFDDYSSRSPSASAYRELNSRAQDLADHVFLHHSDAIQVWFAGLDLYLMGMTGGWFLSDDLDSDIVEAWTLIGDILGLGLDTSKACLDLTVRGHYSLALAGARHLLESAIRVRYLHFFPSEHRDWIPRVKTPSFSMMRRKLEAVPALHDIKESFALMNTNYQNVLSKGPHPSGIGLLQVKTDDESRRALGPNYRPELMQVALDSGLQAMSWLLAELSVMRPELDQSWRLRMDRFTDAVEALIAKHQPIST